MNKLFSAIKKVPDLYESFEAIQEFYSKKSDIRRDRTVEEVIQDYFVALGQ